MKYKINNRSDYENQMNREINRKHITKQEKWIDKNEITIKKLKKIIKNSNDDYSTQVKEVNRMLHMTKRSIVGLKYINLINGYLAIVDIALKEVLNDKKEMLLKKQEKYPAMTDYMNQEGKLNILMHPISYNINHSLELLMKYLIELSGEKLPYTHNSKELYKKIEYIIEKNYSKYKVKLKKYKHEQEKKYGRNEHHTKTFNEKVYMKGYGLAIHTKYLETLVNEYAAENKDNTLDRYPKGKKKIYKIKDLKLLYKDISTILQIQTVFTIITTN